MHPRLAALVVLAGSALGLAGCTSARPSRPAAERPLPVPALDPVTLRPRPECPADCENALAEARRLAGLGRRSDACAVLLAVLENRPRFLDGERYLQDLLNGTSADVWLRERYRTRLRRDPSDADANYLAARIETSKELQAELFARALAADPGHPWARLGFAITMERSGRTEDAVREAWSAGAAAPWFAAPWLYLGSRAWGRGSPEAAERYLREAVHRSPEEPRAWTSLAGAYEDLDRDEEACRAAVEAIRRAPGDPHVLAGMARLLERIGSAADLDAALRAVEPARREAGDPGMVQVFRGRLLVTLRRFGEARDALLDARRLGAARGDTAVALRRARIGAGELHEAVLEYLADLPRDVCADADDRSAAWTELLAATNGTDVARQVDALRAVGWYPEAAEVLSAALGEDPSMPRTDDSVRDFVEALGTYARGLRRRNRAGDYVPLDEALDAVGRIAALHGLGERALDGVNVRSYAFLGSFATSADSTGGFRRLFEDHGLLLMAGQRSGKGAELVVGRLVSQRRGVRATVLGREVVYDEHWMEAEGLPDGLASRSGVAGITIDRFVAIQLDVVRRGPPAFDDGLPFLGRASVNAAALRGLDSPSDVARRIEHGLAVRGTLERDEIDTVIKHERVHVLDAQRLLPPLQHPFEALSFAVSHGFSGHAMEESLEARAAVGALIDAAEPRAALASLVGFLPSEAGDTPHTAGYHRAVEVGVDEVVRDPAAFRSIDLRWNVVQQLDRLTPDEIRELGRRILRRID